MPNGIVSQKEKIRETLFARGGRGVKEPTAEILPPGQEFPNIGGGGDTPGGTFSQIGGDAFTGQVPTTRQEAFEYDRQLREENERDIERVRAFVAAATRAGASGKAIQARLEREGLAKLKEYETPTWLNTILARERKIPSAVAAIDQPIPPDIAKQMGLPVGVTYSQASKIGARVPTPGKVDEFNKKEFDAHSKLVADILKRGLKALPANLQFLAGNVDKFKEAIKADKTILNQVRDAITGTPEEERLNFSMQKIDELLGRVGPSTVPTTPTIQTPVPVPALEDKTPMVTTGRDDLDTILFGGF